MPRPKLLIDDSRIWEYYTRDYGSTEDTSFTESLSRYKFDGTEEADGRNYSRLVITDRVSWTKEKYTDAAITAPVTREINECVALLREENGKVFMKLEEDSIYRMNPETGKIDLLPVEPGEEVVLYDFTAYKGETLAVPVASLRDNLYWSDQTVTEYNSEWSNEFNMPLRKIGIGGSEKYPWWTYVLFVGNIGKGNMLEFGSFDEPDCLCGREEWFNNLYDSEGKVLYEGTGRKAPDPGAVGNISAEIGKEAPMYDLMGRRIAKPLPGSVYIRDGKKYVGK